QEFGATTGRPRRCGWIDLVALKYTCMVNGVTKIIMTKADVLDAFKDLEVCTAYQVNGKRTAEVPFQMTRVRISPEWKSFSGWNTDITKLRRAAELPVQMNNYMDFINNFLGVTISYISNGPGRDQLIEI
ncbi:MAG TPA: adenylosuccinate synthetase, partial [Flavitalea sp.]|nr:adenylosuccinate synthetase [Flavitalea sp.]